MLQKSPTAWPPLKFLMDRRHSFLHKSKAPALFPVETTAIFGKRDIWVTFPGRFLPVPGFGKMQREVGHISLEMWTGKLQSECCSHVKVTGKKGARPLLGSRAQIFPFTIYQQIKCWRLDGKSQRRQPCPQTCLASVAEFFQRPMLISKNKPISCRMGHDGAH